MNAAAVERHASDDETGAPPVPAAYDGRDDPPASVLPSLIVEGEEFAVSRGEGGGTDYDWLSGPNKNYGFSSSGPPDRPVEAHRSHIRNFLSMINPETGYIGDD